MLCVLLILFFSHLDPDFNSPLPDNEAIVGSAGGFVANPDGIEMLSAMGFTAEQATAALKSTQNDVERAADWLFSHSDDLDSAVANVMNGDSVGSGSTGAAGDINNLVYDSSDEGRYDVVAVISHLGKNTSHGHYVCHIKKGDKWVLYNDDKVTEAKNPPLKYGFMYLFKRRDALV